MKDLAIHFRILLIVLVIASCAPKAVEQAQTVVPVTPEESVLVEVTVGNAPPVTETEARQILETQIDLFERSHPNVRINLDTWTWNPKEFANTLAKGTVPDVIIVPATEGQLIIDQGYAADITDLFNEWSVGKDFSDAIMSPYRKNGRIYAIPSRGYAMGLFYDKKLFKAAGLVDSYGEPVAPTTWDEFVEAAKKIKAEDKVPGFCIFTTSNQGGWTFMNWGWQAGGEFERYENGKWKATFAEQPIVNALQFIKDLRWKYDVLQGDLFLDAGHSFPLVAKHQCGMAIYAPEWFDAVVTTNKGNLDDLGLTVLPAGPAGHASLMGGVYRFIKASASPQIRRAAFEWIAWSGFSREALNIENNLRKQTGSLVGLPSLPKFKPGSATAEMEKELSDRYLNVPYYQTFSEETAKYVRPEPPIATQELYAILDTVIQSVLTDQDSDVQALLTQAAQKFQLEYLDVLER